jgi:hypothetical protein
MQYTENEIVGVARVQKIENTLYVAILSLAKQNFNLNHGDEVVEYLTHEGVLIVPKKRGEMKK